MDGMKREEAKAVGVPHVKLAMMKMTAALAKEGIGKEKQNTEQKYKFRGIDDVRNAVAKLQAECGLLIYPHMISRVEKERQTKSGGFAYQVVVVVDMHFVSTEDGSEIISRWENEAVDYSDKATNKAMSQAYKTAIINTFNIPTEGEKEADDESHKELKSSKRTAFTGHEACDAFVHKYLKQVSESTTRHGLKDVGEVHKATILAMANSEDDHERMAAGIVRGKHAEKLDEMRQAEATAPKSATVGGALAEAKGSKPVLLSDEIPF